MTRLIIGLMVVVLASVALSEPVHAAESEAIAAATVESKNVDQQLALMNDSQARAMLRQLLENEPQAVSSASMLSTVDRYSGQFQQQLQRFHAAAQAGENSLADLTAQVLASSGGLLPFLGLVVLMLAGGYAVERGLGYRMHRLSQGAGKQSSSGWWPRLCFTSIRTLMDVVRVGIFFIAAMLVPVILFDDGDPARLTLLALVSAITMIRIGVALSRALFAPYARGIRPLQMACSTAGRLHRWITAFIITYFSLSHFVQLLDRLGYPDPLHQAFMALSGIGLNLMLVALMWFNRDAITGLFRSASSVSETTNKNPLSGLLVQTWPLLAITWLFILWAIWAFHTFVGNQLLAEKVALSWWITLFFPLLDRLFFVILNQLTTLSWLQSRNFDQRSPRLVSVLMGGFRLILVCLSLIAVTESWGMGSLAMFESSSGQRGLSMLVDVLAISLVAYIAWELIYSLIERHLPEPPTQESDSLEGEGGAGGASRTETLLPLLRSFLMALIVVTLVLSILHAVGIQIAPLLASAGVIGIAIGFGSQKLVQDVISGIFFLWDDAFRRGEYIQTGTLMGTVEQISIRSMQLRHHLGAVQTVPYGSIDTVKNLSRDWVTMKLEMRLPYDTDIEKVRKIIKKIGLQMLEDEEMGPNMLMPLKSQGVSRMEASALIVRMKFTAKPGEQWVIRREAYRLVRDALQKAGITFAVPEVRVRMPDGAEPGALTEQQVQQQVQQAVAGRTQLDSPSAESGPKTDDR